MRHIGIGTVVDPTAVITSERYWIGDHCYIGPGVRISASTFVLGDFSKIHSRTFVYTQNHVFPDGRVVLGHNTWIGQDCVIDGSGGIVAGNNLGVGIGSQLYTHISNGDWLIGSRFRGAKPMLLGNDVWFVGHCLCSPIRAGNRCMAMLGSVVTKDMESDRVYAGVPAADRTDVFGKPYEDTTWGDRISELRRIVGLVAPGAKILIDAEVDFEAVDASIWDEVFCVSSRRYRKTGSDASVKIMKHISGFRAKFIPWIDPLAAQLEWSGV